LKLLWDLTMAAAWVLVLVTVMLDLARAGPVPMSKPTTTGKGCHMGRFQSLLPRELEGFKKAKDALEESLSLKNWSCSSHRFPRTRDLRQRQVWERPVAVEAELDRTLKVLGAVADSSSGVILDQPLHTLHHIHSELQACIPARPTEATKEESQGCLKASVTFNLFRLLIRDLRIVASGDLHI
uniref:Interferon lambda 1 n=1 Tax=Monodon monoceros TaxID=40151 RepID=A0A8C6ALT3_MONMO